MNTQTASDTPVTNTTPVAPAPKKEAKKTKAPKAKEAKAETAKEPKVKKLKTVGPFNELQIKDASKKEDKNYPMSFKAWAKKYAPNYDGTIETFRTAYEDDMREALRLKQDAKLAKQYDKDFKTVINHRSTRVNDLNMAMRRLFKGNLINGYRLEFALGTSVKAKKSVVFEIGYSIKGLAVVQASKRKKALMDLYMAKTA